MQTVWTELWGSGYEGRYIEDLINSAFLDFAPYAAADQERLSVTRLHPGLPAAASSVIVEGNGDCVLHTQHAAVGSATFSTAPALQVRSHLRVPLPLPPPEPLDERRRRASLGLPTSEALQQQHKRQLLAAYEDQRQQQQQQQGGRPRSRDGDSQVDGEAEGGEGGALRRFAAIGRGGVCQASTGLPRISGERVDYIDARRSSLGQLEVEGLTVPAWFGPHNRSRGGGGDASVNATRAGAQSLANQTMNNHNNNSAAVTGDGRFAIGLSAGPFAARVSSVRAAGAGGSPEHSGSGSDDTYRPPPSLLQQVFPPDRVHSIDAAVCLPLTPPVTLLRAGDAGRAREAPWALTVGLQHPIEAGDTLVALALHTDRATSYGQREGAPALGDGSVLLPLSSASAAAILFPPSSPVAVAGGGDAPAVAAPGGRAQGLGKRRSAAADLTAAKGYGDEEDDARVPMSLSAVPGSTQLVPLPSTSGTSSKGRSEGARSVVAPRLLPFAVPEISVRLLLVQTLLRRGSGSPNASGIDGSGGSDQQQRKSMSSTLRRSSSGARPDASAGLRETGWGLPTLLGVQVCLWQELLRLSLATIFHDSTRDMEAAAAVDLTPVLPHTPTVFRLGWNDTGRVAIGITTLFYKRLCVTLGTHIARKEQTRFGLEIKF